MIVQFKDYNSVNEIINQYYIQEWNEILTILQNSPIHLKASDQKGIQGRRNFDPVGTNQYIRDHLTPFGWKKIKLPSELSFLGTDVDFGKDGILIEAQFSNYPFLLNNIIRSEVLFKGRFQTNEIPTRLVIIITKAHMFPSANSTLYYQQATRQIDSLDRLEIFDIPLRLVGLFGDYGDNIQAKWTEYTHPRYSRKVVTQNDISCSIEGSPNRRAVIKIN